MDITPGYMNREQNRPVASNTARPVGAAENEFSQSIQNAARPGGADQAAPGIPPQNMSPTADGTARAQAGGPPGVTPLTAPGAPVPRDTAQELQTRRLLNDMAGRLAVPANIADYPQTALTYAGQLATQVAHAGFAMPDSSSRTANGRRGPDVRSIKPVDAPEEGSGVELDSF